MNDTTSPRQDLEKVDPNKASVPAKSIQLGASITQLDVSNLPEAQVQELQMRQAQALIDIHKKAQELKVDVGALDAGLSSMVQHTKQVSEAGDSITITHSATTSLGRTEVIMGNTDTANKGKLTRSQAGLKDNTLIYVIIAAVAAVIVALILAR